MGREMGQRDECPTRCPTYRNCPRPELLLVLLPRRDRAVTVMSELARDVRNQGYMRIFPNIHFVYRHHRNFFTPSVRIGKRRERK